MGNSRKYYLKNIEIIKNVEKYATNKKIKCKKCFRKFKPYFKIDSSRLKTESFKQMSETNLTDLTEVLEKKIKHRRVDSEKKILTNISYLSPVEMLSTLLNLHCFFKSDDEIDLIHSSKNNSPKNNKNSPKNKGILFEKKIENKINKANEYVSITNSYLLKFHPDIFWNLMLIFGDLKVTTSYDDPEFIIFENVEEFINAKKMEKTTQKEKNELISEIFKFEKKKSSYFNHDIKKLKKISLPKNETENQIKLFFRPSIKKKENKKNKILKINLPKIIKEVNDLRYKDFMDLNLSDAEFKSFNESGYKIKKVGHDYFSLKKNFIENHYLKNCKDRGSFFRKKGKYKEIHSKK